MEQVEEGGKRVRNNLFRPSEGKACSCEAEELVWFFLPNKFDLLLEVDGVGE